MSGNRPRPDKFLPLLNDACDGTLTEAQIRELAAVLDSDAATRKVFIDHISLQADIRFLGRAERLCNIGLAGVQAIVPQAAVVWSRSNSNSRLPLQHPPRHGRLFLLGLAGGVFGGNGDFRGRAADRLPRARVPA